ncbi:hypothetical protein AB3S75_031813 [Citrus x aurantiifolia]
MILSFSRRTIHINFRFLIIPLETRLSACIACSLVLGSPFLSLCPQTKKQKSFFIFLCQGEYTTKLLVQLRS